jgi:hypothetical protein
MKRGSLFLFFFLIISCLCPLAYSAPLVFDLNNLDDKGNCLGNDNGTSNSGFKAGINGNHEYFDTEITFAKHPLSGGSALTYLTDFSGGNLIPRNFDVLNSVTEILYEHGSFYPPAQIMSIKFDKVEGQEGVALVATTPAPESTTMLLLGFGLMGLAIVGRRRFMK